MEDTSFTESQDRPATAPPPREAWRRKMRDDVLDAARAMAAERGWDSVSLSQVASRAEVSRPTVYKEFGSRGGLSQALDVGVVRVGSDAITVTAGGLDGGEKESVDTAVRQGTERLKDVLAGRTPPASPTA
ncbi:helix-turn-helix domain-containing protein [Streptomyces sp. NPDC052013]|uniref:helix-turn-helix domain-containing protein n=1 Tax=Streptomyces sp. NPDC052013 TaxID=3365679 RepID=UPI0037D59D13